MMIGLGDTTCVKWNWNDLMATGLQPWQLFPLDQNGNTSWAPQVDANGCLNPIYVRLLPQGYIASHTQSVTAPAPVPVAQAPAPAAPLLPIVSSPTASAPTPSALPAINVQASTLPNAISTPLGISTAVPGPSTSGPGPSATTPVSGTLIPGIPDNYLYIGAGALVLLMLMGGKK